MLKFSTNVGEMLLHTGKCKHLHSQALLDDSDMLMRSMEIRSQGSTALRIEWTIPTYAPTDLDSVANAAFDRPYALSGPVSEWLLSHVLRPLAFLKNLQGQGSTAANCPLTILVPDTIIDPLAAAVAGGILLPAIISAYLNYAFTVRTRYYDPTEPSADAS